MRIYLKDIIINNCIMWVTNNRVFSIHKKKKIDKQKDFQQCNDQAAFWVFNYCFINQTKSMRKILLKSYS
jgi:hypothetical protein